MDWMHVAAVLVGCVVLLCGFLTGMLFGIWCAWLYYSEGEAERRRLENQVDAWCAKAASTIG